MGADGAHTAWFVTVVVSMALFGALYTICISALSRLENKRPGTEAA